MSYAELEQFQRYLNLGDHELSEVDLADLQDVLDDAAAHIDEECNRTFTVPEGTTTRTYPVVDRTVFVDDISDPESIVVEVGGTEVDWSYDPPSFGRPVTTLTVDTTATRVDVTGPFGWAATPRQIVRANLIMAHRLYKRADTPSGVGGFDAAGAVVRMPWRDPDVVKLLAPFRKVTVA
jgi:hypothetical protein